MRRLIKNIGKNCLSISFIVLVTMMFFLTNLNAYSNMGTTLQIKAAIEGYYDISNGNLKKNAELYVYLRDAQPPYSLIDFAKGEIDRNTLEGSFTFSYVTTGQYYIILKSRSMIETWSRKGGELIKSDSRNSYDFTSGKEKAFGDNLQFGSNNKHACIFNGDVNQDGFINVFDLELVEKNMINFTTGDVPEDLNGDGYVGKADYNIVYRNFKDGVRAINPMNILSPSDGIVTGFNVRIKALVEGLCELSPSKLQMTKDPFVTIYLRNTTPPFKLVDKAEGFIDKSTFYGYFTFQKVNPGRYYIVIKSKNSIETWSRRGGEVFLRDGKLMYDFTAGKNMAFGENLLEHGKYTCIYSGDVNQDGIIDKMDINNIVTDMNKKGDLVTDLNGDELIDEKDFNIAFKNWESNVHAITPIADPLANEDGKRSITVQIKALIEGLCFLSPSEMNMTKDPYVTVYLRNVNVPYKLVDMSEGYIDKKSLYGYFTFPKANPGRYYIVIKYKNSIETWSRKGGEDFTKDAKLSYDFTAGKSMAFGENMLEYGKHTCIYSGDVNQDGIINKLDIYGIETDMNKKGDLVTDLNGDEFIDEKDYNIAFNNWENNICKIVPQVAEPPDVSKNENFFLKQNSPNPFNPSTQISFNVATTSNVKLYVYDISGRLIEQLVDMQLAAGVYTYKWDGTNYASGTYFYRLNVNGKEQTMKMQLIK